MHLFRELSSVAPLRGTVASLVLLTTLAVASATALAQSEDPQEDVAPLGSERAPLPIELPDSLLNHYAPESSVAAPADPADSVRTVYTSSSDAPLPMEAFEVRARRILRELGADRIRLDRGLIEVQDGDSVADLGALLPSTHLTVNSRGEALFQVRGSSERHLHVELDGIPLTLPWDERADLSLLPLLGVGGVEAQRGANSVLDPPNALAGSISLQTLTQGAPGTSTRLGAWRGESEAWGGQFLHLRRDGAWNTTVALEHRRQGAVLLPKEVDVDYFADARRFENQDPSRRVRTNTDLEQTALLLGIGRGVGEAGNVRLLVQASDGEKGVGPEMNLEADEARYWRYPQTRRLLVGVGLKHQTTRWTLDAVTSIDLHRQDIDRYDDASYTQVVGFENGEDRTGFGRITALHRFGPQWELAVRGTVRHAVRDQQESDVDGDLRFAQTLGGVASELTYRPGERWRLRTGAGYEGAQTPDTGDKPAREADHDVALHLAVERDLGSGGRAHAAASRRPRFPSLRELFSEALDRFLVNPTLGPEVQTAAELGYSRSSARLDWSLNGFAQLVDGPIERVVVEVDSVRLRQRVNLDEVRNIGIELGLVARPLRGVTLDVQHTQLWSRSRVDGAFDGRVEDRPDWMSTAAASWTHRSGVRVRTELLGVGPRSSLGASGLERLGTDLRWNLRLGYRHFGTGRWYEGSEWFVRVDNLLDETTESQIGLLESGRTLRLGWRVDLQS